MTLPLVPRNAFGVEGGLLTALVIGFAFGFALERGGFGNARKLAAQFYFYDMTVFKVMFTAILTAMTGLYAAQAFGWADLSLVWINPTFLGAQLVAGFLLGVGFIVSGLCPGTGFVSMASGKTDALFAIAGIFGGTLLFGLTVDAWPGLHDLYKSPGSGRVLLPDLLGVPAPWLALAIVLMALGAFVGAEKVEAIFAKKRDAVDDPTDVRAVPDRRGKFALAGGLALVCLVAGLAGSPATPAAATAELAAPQPISPLTLAERLIARDPELLVLDLRAGLGDDAVRVPGAIPVADAEGVPAWVSGAVPGTTIVLVGEGEAAVPAGWPAARDYAWLEGGAAAWKAQVLTPVEPASQTPAAYASAAKQNQIAAFYSGAAVSAAAAPPPPPPAAGGAKKKKASGGC